MTKKIGTQDLDAHHAPLQRDLEAAALRVIASGRYILGPEVEAFEKECAAACGLAHAVGVSSGTDALLVALMALGVGPGDEVVTTPFSFFATAGAIVRLGARPVFADIEADTYNLDPALAIRRIGPRTKAVIAVHLFGRRARPFDTTLPIVEDAAQAIGTPGVGSTGVITALSFFPSKNLGGFGDGGMVLTPDAQLAERLRVLRAHGSKPKYHHLVVGGNFRLDEMQAALLRVKLPHLPRWTAARRKVATAYRRALAGLPLRLPPEDPGCVWNQYVVTVPDGKRDALAKHLTAASITTAVYYPEPLHLQPCFADLGFKAGDFPVAERACGEVLALPIYPELPDEAVDEVAGAVGRFFKR